MHDDRILAADAAARYAALAGANGLTRFAKGEYKYEVTLRFQLPNEPLECPIPPV